MNGIRVSLLFLIANLGSAQMLQQVRGRVQSDLAHLGTDFMVELENLDHHEPATKTHVSGDGSFEFREVPTGRHALRITTVFGDTICEQQVDVSMYTGELSIRLPKRNVERPGSGAVSVRELQRPVPRKAYQAFMESQRGGENAVHKLELAVRLHPEYTAARVNLGVQYTRLGKRKEALEQFEKAIASGENSAIGYGNLAHAYYSVGRMQDAEYAARRAVSLDPRYLRGHYMLGSVLGQRVRPGALEFAPEAARHLRLGAPVVPHAHIEIAMMYLAEDDPYSAAEEFQLYLKSGEQAERAKVERWLASFP